LFTTGKQHLEHCQPEPTQDSTAQRNEDIYPCLVFEHTIPSVWAVQNHTRLYEREASVIIALVFGWNISWKETSRCYWRIFWRCELDQDGAHWRSFAMMIMVTNTRNFSISWVLNMYPHQALP